MTPERLLRTGIDPALAELESKGIRPTPEARRIVLTAALQETNLRARRQIVSGGIENGPASSFWQFEKGGGCVDVLTRPSVAARMEQICVDYNIQPTPQALWEAMRYNDVVAAAAARLLFYILPDKLPLAAEDGWNQYLAAWRPGKPHKGTWAGHWATASAICGLAP